MRNLFLLMENRLNRILYLKSEVGTNKTLTSSSYLRTLDSSLLDLLRWYAEYCLLHLVGGNASSDLVKYRLHRSELPSARTAWVRRSRILTSSYGGDEILAELIDYRQRSSIMYKGATRVSCHVQSTHCCLAGL